MKNKTTTIILAGVMLFAGFITGFVTCMKNHNPVNHSYKDVGGNIDIEYYLEVSEDSIWVEGVASKKVYCGKYSDLDSLIIQDNL
jgi:hypothetical protein